MYFWKFSCKIISQKLSNLQMVYFELNKLKLKGYIYSVMLEIIELI